jgi:hypothetical protein
MEIGLQSIRLPTGAFGVVGMAICLRGETF